MNIKHSIVVICFNQEKFIRQALDSVLNQFVKPYEIIIGDDCSSDGTRTILYEYKAKYPDIITLTLRDKNVGIFANLNMTTKNVTGDIVSFLAGDDWFRPRLIENMNKKINELGLNPLSSKFLLLPDVVFHAPDGGEIVKKNSERNLLAYSAIGSVFRRRLITRNVGFSRAFFDLWPDYPDDANALGLWADFAQYCQHMQHCEKLIPTNFEGPVYRIGVGAASKCSIREANESFYRSLSWVRTESSKGKIKLDYLDAKFLDFLIACQLITLAFSFKNCVLSLSAAIRVIKLDVKEIRPVLMEISRVVYFSLSLLKNRVMSSVTQIQKLI